MKRSPLPGWGHRFLPEPGCYPPYIEPRRDERVLHIALQVAGDPQLAQELALRSITRMGGAYECVEWTHNPRTAATRAMVAAVNLRPTLVFMQIQDGSSLHGRDVEELRSICDPSCVIVNWDGDQHYTPQDPQRRWFVDIGRACDASLICNTLYPAQYSEMGVRGAGYLQVGVDVDLWRPTEPAPNTPEIVLLASDYPHLPAYTKRVDVCRKLTAEFPGRFAVYGHGWRRQDVASRPFLTHEQEAPVYSASWAAVSMSIRSDLPRYTSDRLWRCLAAGALTLVEDLPDREGLGLVDGHNCLLWRTPEELTRHVRNVLQYRDEYALVRKHARELAMEHSWEARMGELAAITQTVREQRKAQAA